MVYNTEERVKSLMGRSIKVSSGDYDWKDFNAGEVYQISSWDKGDRFFCVYIENTSGGKLDILSNTEELYSDIRLLPEEPEEDLTNLDKPLKEYPKATQLKLLSAWLDGKVEGEEPLGGWRDHVNPKAFHLNRTYRVKPEKSPEKLKEFITNLENNLKKTQDSLSEAKEELMNYYVYGE